LGVTDAKKLHYGDRNSRESVALIQPYRLFTPLLQTYRRYAAAPQLELFTIKKDIVYAAN
jgi:hypothetical protein